MTKELHVSGLGAATIGDNRLNVSASLPIVVPLEAPKARGSNRLPGAAPEYGGVGPMPPKETRRPSSREILPDLHSNCPVCGDRYRPGEGVLAVACLSFAMSTVPSSPPDADCSPGGRIILGHNRCVLPRLLTLLAGFQPEARFVRASLDFSASQAALPERQHDEP